MEVKRVDVAIIGAGQRRPARRGVAAAAGATVVLIESRRRRNDLRPRRLHAVEAADRRRRRSRIDVAGAGALRHPRRAACASTGAPCMERVRSRARSLRRLRPPRRRGASPPSSACTAGRASSRRRCSRWTTTRGSRRGRSSSPPGRSPSIPPSLHGGARRGARSTTTCFELRRSAALDGGRRHRSSSASRSARRCTASACARCSFSATASISARRPIPRCSAPSPRCSAPSSTLHSVDRRSRSGATARNFCSSWRDASGPAPGAVRCRAARRPAAGPIWPIWIAADRPQARRVWRAAGRPRSPCSAVTRRSSWPATPATTARCCTKPPTRARSPAPTPPPIPTCAHTSAGRALEIAFTDPNMAIAGATWSELDTVRAAIGVSLLRRPGPARGCWAQNRGLMPPLRTPQRRGALLGAEMFGPRVEHMAHLLAWAIQARLTVDHGPRRCRSTIRSWKRGCARRCASSRGCRRSSSRLRVVSFRVWDVPSRPTRGARRRAAGGSHRRDAGRIVPRQRPAAVARPGATLHPTPRRRAMATSEGRSQNGPEPWKEGAGRMKIASEAARRPVHLQVALRGRREGDQSRGAARRRTRRLFLDVPRRAAHDGRFPAAPGRDEGDRPSRCRPRDLQDRARHRAEVPGIDAKTFAEKVEASKKGCSVSKALAGVPDVTVSARLVG